MPRIQRRTGLIFLLILLTGCTQTVSPGLPLAILPLQSTPVLLKAAQDATATPTPFQPLPPTPVYLPTSAAQDTPLPPASPTPAVEPSAAQQSSLSAPKGQVNILLLGTDFREGEGNFRTDSIMLVTLNPDLGTVNLTSFPRDLYITLPGYGMNRINTAYEFGGFKLVGDTFEYNFGIRPDHYVMIGFRSFKSIVDTWGGLDVDVKEPLADYKELNWLSIPAGKVHMDADVVTWYVRARKTTSDFSRAKRQQEVLRAIYEKLVSLDALKHVPEYYEIYKDNVVTDLTFGDIIKLLPMATKIKNGSQIHNYFISHECVYDWITPDGGMVLLPRPDAIRAVLRKSLNIDQ